MVTDPTMAGDPVMLSGNEVVVSFILGVVAFALFRIIGGRPAQTVAIFYGATAFFGALIILALTGG